jgi:serine/threonine protein kinase
VGLALQLCSALAAAHAVGVIHRDLKPSNIIIVRDAHGAERIKLVDFGVAQVRRPEDRKLTGIGALIGTPEYMAPEQLLAFDDIDERADVYALGITMFECLTGQVPYAGEYPMVLLAVTRPGPAPSILPLCPTVDVALADVIEKAISKRREDRFQSAAEFGRALRAAASTARPNTALLAPAQRSERQPPPLPKAASVALVPQAAVNNESRKAARAPYCTPVALLTPDGKRWEGRNEDISAGGMLLVSNAACAVGQKVRVRFATPIDGKLVTCSADVRWVRDARTGDQSGLRAIGLAFTDGTPQMVASIESFVEFMADANLA